MMLYGYYDYTPDDPIVQYITQDKPQFIHLYNRDGVYKGTIIDPLIVSRVVRNWRNETIPSLKLFMVMIAECFPDKIVKMEINDIPSWHPSLPPCDKRKLPSIPFVSGPHMGGTYSSRGIPQYLIMDDQQEYGEQYHLYELELDPTATCGYQHVLSGNKLQIEQYCRQHNITNVRE